MSSLQPRLGHRLLRCPLCKFGFTAAAGALVCRNGHSFDLSRESYINLLTSRRRRPAAGGDSPVQLGHRAAFLDAGHFDTVAEMVANHVQQVDHRTRHILDAGTGHHLARIVARLTGSVVSLGLDISKDALRLGARRWPTPAFAVTDLWAEWPVPNAAVDLIVSVFAPKNFPKMARVLRPGGWLALAYPGSRHLIEPRELFALLRQNDESSERYAHMTARLMGRSSVTRFHHRAVLDPAAVRAAILMGWNARHVDPSILDVGTAPLSVTFDINVLFARNPERKA